MNGCLLFLWNSLFTNSVPTYLAIGATEHAYIGMCGLPINNDLSSLVYPNLVQDMPLVANNQIKSNGFFWFALHNFILHLFYPLMIEFAHILGLLRKTSCANEIFYFQNKRMAQLGFPIKPSCANVKFYLWMSMRTLLLLSIDWPIWSEFFPDISLEWAELGLSQTWQLPIHEGGLCKRRQ